MELEFPGLICARTLADHGCEVRVFEKSRGVGGRMSHRRVEGTSGFDHGAQYFTARDQRFKRYVKSWKNDGVVQPWDGRIVAIENGVIQAEKSNAGRYVAVPGMSSLGKHIASDLTVQTETRVTGVTRSDDRWLVSDDQGSRTWRIRCGGGCSAIETGRASIGGQPRARCFDLASIEMNPCWAMMLGFGESLNLGFDGAFVQNSALSWIARNNSKPGREASGEHWVLHANPEWSKTHIEKSPEQVTQSLLDEFWQSRRRPEGGTDAR